MGERFDLVVRGGTVVTEAATVAVDVGVRGGRIAALAPGLGRGEEEIDAAGLLVMPGGVETHCHLDQMSGMNIYTADGFRSGSISAAFGGTTTIVPFMPHARGQTLAEALADYHGKAEGESLLDHAFHLIVAEANDAVLGEMPGLIAKGYTSFKVFTTYPRTRLDDASILKVMDVVARHGAILMIHAESHELLTYETERLLAAGKTAPKYHAVAHSVGVERDSISRMATYAEATGATVLIVHVTTADGCDAIRAARARGVPFFGETCQQYLVLTAEDLDRPGFEGAKYCFSPPPRDARHQQALWAALADGTLQAFTSDHAPYRFDETGKKANGDGVPFNQIPKGVPGLETRLPILFSEGVMRGRLSPVQFARLAATSPAKLYGLYPKKGAVAVGADADLALWDPARSVTLSVDALHDNVDYTPYEGLALRGWPVTTVQRGAVLVANGELRAEPGRGRFLTCGRPQRP